MRVGDTQRIQAALAIKDTAINQLGCIQRVADTYGTFTLYCKC